MVQDLVKFKPFSLMENQYT